MEGLAMLNLLFGTTAAAAARVRDPWRINSTLKFKLCVLMTSTDSLVGLVSVGFDFPD